MKKESKYIPIRNTLNAVSPSFCVAKWKQVTLHLQTGMTHSCHHPVPHKIPLEEIKENPSALHNTNFKKEQRRMMLEGKRPEECDYCWRVEDSSEESLSDRTYKSADSWALPYLEEVSTKPWDDNVFPSYLEVSFSNACNFSCTYCGPEFSSKWVENLKQHGPIKLLEDTKYVQWAQGWQDLDNIAFKARDHNPYVEAFWKWWPEAYKHLKVYRITGGEPLLSKETFRSMDWFVDNPNTDLEFSINSNLGVPEKLWRQFVEKLKVLTSGNYINRFTLFTSVDGWGERAEYARPGLDFELFKKRFEEILEIGNIRIVIMCTFNIFSITSILNLFKWQLELKSKYNPDITLMNFEKEFKYRIGDELTHQERKDRCRDHYGLVGIDTPYLRNPSFLDHRYADRDLIQNYLIPAMNWMAKNSGNDSWGMHQGFEQNEIDKMKRILIDSMHFTTQHSDDHELVIENRAKFYDFVNDIDRRYGRNFLEVFPEMAEFYEKCKKAKELIISK